MIPVDGSPFDGFPKILRGEPPEGSMDTYQGVGVAIDMKDFVFVVFKKDGIDPFAPSQAWQVVLLDDRVEGSEGLDPLTHMQCIAHILSRKILLEGSELSLFRYFFKV